MDKKIEIEYINSYDGIRAIAVFGVLFFHMFPYKVKGGFLGVSIFLVLAGFLSMKKVMEQDRYNDKSSTLELILKRITKLLPLLAFFIFTINLYLFIFMSQYLPGTKYQAVSGLFFVNNIAQMLHGDSYFESVSFLKPFTHLWALSLEMQLYVIFYIIVGRYYKREKKKKFAILFFIITLISYILMIVIYLNTKNITRVYYSPDTRMFSFFIGSLGALFLIDDREKIEKYGKNSTFICFLIITFIIISFFKLSSGRDMYLYQMMIFSIVTVILLMFSISNDTLISKILNIKVLKYIGKRGYAIYLWHYPVIKISQKIFAYSQKNIIIFSLFQIAISFIISEISYQIFLKGNIIGKKAKTVMTSILIILVIFLPYKAHGEGLKTLQDLDVMQKKIQQNENKEIKNRKMEKVHTTTQPQLKVEKEIKTTTNSQLSIKENKEFNYNGVNTAKQMIEKFSKIYDKEEFSINDYEKYKDVNISLVGDSVGDMASPYIRAFFKNITIDAKVSRQMYKGFEPYSRLKAEGKLGKVLILELGTNGNFQISSAEDIIKDANIPVVLVSINIPDPIEDTINKKLYSLAEKHKNVYIADWHGYCKGKKELFYSDATHPNDSGSKVYAYLVAQKVIEALKNS